MQILEKVMYDALSATGIEVSQRPVTGTASKYLTWNETLGTLERHASNGATRVHHNVTVDLFSRKEPLSSEVMSIISTLKSNGVQARNWGSMDYEDDTGWYHLPIVCRVTAAID